MLFPQLGNTSSDTTHVFSPFDFVLFELVFGARSTYNLQELLASVKRFIHQPVSIFVFFSPDMGKHQIRDS